MNRLILIALTLAACTDDGPLPASEDPRTVPCGTFRMEGYDKTTPATACYFDVGDLDWFTIGPPVPPATTSVFVIGGYCGPNCGSGGSGAGFVSGTTWKGGAIRWTGDTELGLAVVVGDGTQCIWTRCSRVE